MKEPGRNTCTHETTVSRINSFDVAAAADQFSDGNLRTAEAEGRHVSLASGDCSGDDRKLVRLVGDNAALRQAAAEILGAAGYRVRVHTTGAAALAEIDHQHPCCILIRSDAREFSGLSMQIELKRQAVLWPVILFGHSRVNDVVQALKNGAMDFIEPPFDPVALVRAVEAAFAKVDEVHEQIQTRNRARILMARLTAREGEVVRGLMEGLPNKLTAYRMGVSVRTVEVYRASMMHKLQLKSVSSIIRLALAAGQEPSLERWGDFQTAAPIRRSGPSATHDGLRACSRPATGDPTSSCALTQSTRTEVS